MRHTVLVTGGSGFLGGHALVQLQEAGRAAWDFIAEEGGALELAVVNPVLVLGPVLGPDYSTSIRLVQRLMDGEMPGCPRLAFGVVDVRDVVDLHLRAGHDRPRGSGRALPRRLREGHVHRRDERDAPGAAGRGGPACPPAASSRTGWCV